MHPLLFKILYIYEEVYLKYGSIRRLDPGPDISG